MPMKVLGVLVGAEVRNNAARSVPGHNLPSLIADYLKDCVEELRVHVD